MVVRPLVRRILAPDERRALPAGDPALVGSAQTAALANGGDAVSQAELNKMSQMIDLAQVQGQVHAHSVQKVGDIADKNPQETVSVIRQWLQESGAAA